MASILVIELPCFSRNRLGSYDCRDEKFFGGTGVILLISGAFYFIRIGSNINCLRSIFLQSKNTPRQFRSGDLWVIGLWSFFLSWYELLQVLFIASLSGLTFFRLSDLA